MEGLRWTAEPPRTLPDRSYRLSLFLNYKFITTNKPQCGAYFMAKFCFPISFQPHTYADCYGVTEPFLLPTRQVLTLFARQLPPILKFSPQFLQVNFGILHSTFFRPCLTVTVHDSLHFGAKIQIRKNYLETSTQSLRFSDITNRRKKNSMERIPTVPRLFKVSPRILRNPKKLQK
jgi:hypothetical protein